MSGLLPDNSPVIAGGTDETFIGNDGDKLKVSSYQAGVWSITQAGSWSVSVSNFPASFGRTWTLASGTDSVTVIQGTAPWAISASSLPLPTGAATAALQTAGNTSLSSIDTKTLAPGQALMAASSPVVIASNQSAIPVSQSGTWTTGRTWNLSNTTDSVNVGNFPAVQAVSQSGTWNINNITGTISLPTGAATEATLSALNGKFNSLGQKTMAASAPVVIASDQSPLISNIRGNTDGTLIGNSGNRLLVDALASISASSFNIERPTYSLVAINVAIANNKSMLSILNAAGSGVVVRLEDLRIVNTQVTAITGVVAEFNLFRMTGHSAGTAVTKQLHDTNDSSSASVTVLTGATVAGESTDNLRRIRWSSDEWGAGAADVESADHATQITENLLNFPSRTKPITLRPGQGITLKQITNSTAGTFNIYCICTEATT